MSVPIGPGDWVECIARTEHPELCVPGGVYQCEAVVPAFGRCPSCDSDASEGLIFVGHPKMRLGNSVLMSWCVCRFRPIYPGGALTKLLMQPIDLPAEPDFTPAKEDA